MLFIIHHEYVCMFVCFLFNGLSGSRMENIVVYVDFSQTDK